ncbi:hypothetical protein ACOME3_004931 [Neoechinorhynchus agilis]
MDEEVKAIQRKALSSLSKFIVRHPPKPLDTINTNCSVQTDAIDLSASECSSQLRQGISALEKGNLAEQSSTLPLPTLDNEDIKSLKQLISKQAAQHRLQQQIIKDHRRAFSRIATKLIETCKNIKNLLLALPSVISRFKSLTDLSVKVSQPRLQLSKECPHCDQSKAGFRNKALDECESKVKTLLSENTDLKKVLSSERNQREICDIERNATIDRLKNEIKELNKELEERKSREVQMVRIEEMVKQSFQTLKGLTSELDERISLDGATVDKFVQTDDVEVKQTKRRKRYLPGSST